MRTDNKEASKSHGLHGWIAEIMRSLCSVAAEGVGCGDTTDRSVATVSFPLVESGATLGWHIGGAAAPKCWSIRNRREIRAEPASEDPPGEGGTLSVVHTDLQPGLIRAQTLVPQH